MKKIIEMVAEGGGDLGVHMYPLICIYIGVLHNDKSDKLTICLTLKQLEMV